MEIEPLNFNLKAMRAAAIVEYLACINYPSNLGQFDVVCFTCGNAANWLRAQKCLRVLEIGPNGDLEPRRWFNQMEIARNWPRHFDATSGHLPWPVMQMLIDQLVNLVLPYGAGQTVYVPTGSGETLVALAMAYPKVDFVAVYDNTVPATQYNPAAPLNGLVWRLAKDVIFKELI